MNCRKLLAGCCALALTLTATGCLGESTGSSENSSTALIEKSADLAVIESTIEEMQDNWHLLGKDEWMQSAIQDLLDAFNRVSADYSRAEMDYYAEWERPYLEKKYQQAYEDYYVAAEMLSWVFYNGNDKSSYTKLFAPYVDETNKGYYLSYSLNRVKSNARSDSATYKDNLDAYYDISNDTELSHDETNIQCAKLYLDNLKTYDTRNGLYDYYHRDYTAAQTSALYQTIQTDLVPIADLMYQNIQNDRRYSKLQKSDYVQGNPFEAIQKYAGNLSAAIQESAKKINEEQLYRLASGDACYDGSYTIALPGEHSALVYLYQAGDFYDFSAAVHEFGHFHSDWRDGTPIYCQENCVDIAEMQSQGMQMLFTTVFDEIYGEDADYLELVSVYDLVDSIVAGFTIGEFENRVMEQIDTITPEKVLEIYEELAESCHFTHSFYEISHLFEQPGYYISYGVSALAALQIYATLQEDIVAGAALYDRISGISSVSGEYQTVEAMNECGFEDIFAPQTLLHAIETLRQYALVA